ncbi:PrgI family protein [Candidatus Saccharibacteria bacterium]|nr:PrgI family protein [Candidatus Saccharibacteria bacterium]
MAQYKVPQDVEAEDKLLGPFTFRQFVYLLIAAAGIAGAWGLFQIFPLLGLIPLPFVFFFGILALPIKKDQPMETYLAAVVSFYLKPNRRIWTAGQRESTIKIIAPKKVEKSRTRDITEDEASHRLSFLATIVDTEGYAIRGDSAMKDEYAAEADTVEDVLDADNPVIDRIIEQEQTQRKQEIVSQMRTAMNRTDALIGSTPVNPATVTTAPVQNPVPLQAPGANYNPQPTTVPVQPMPQQPQMQPQPQPVYQAPQPTPAPMPMPMPQPQPSVQQLTQASLNQAAVNQQMQNLANNNSFSIQTIAQQANRIQQQSKFEQDFMDQVHTDPNVHAPATNNTMVTNNEAGLTAPTFTPMSIPLPHEVEPGQLYRPIENDEAAKPQNDRPDLYGPPTAIFSS